MTHSSQNADTHLVYRLPCVHQRRISGAFRAEESLFAILVIRSILRQVLGTAFIGICAMPLENSITKIPILLFVNLMWYT